MALFGSKKNTKSAALKVEPSEKKTSAHPGNTSHPDAKIVLIRPRITEKSANMTASNVYSFDIGRSATKKEVKEAVKAFYKVTPIKVNVVNVPPKRVKMRRKRGFGTKAGSRKAYVFLKKGEEIQFA